MIGTAVPADRNVISGNSGDGVLISGGLDDHVVGNVIGATADGAHSLPNFEGVHLTGGANNNVIGDRNFLNPDETVQTFVGNLISGNAKAGIDIDGAGTAFNQVMGNRIGTTGDGNNSLPNGWSTLNYWTGGVLVQEGASDNQIGGDGSVGYGNLISGNSANVYIVGAGTAYTIVEGNYIGTNADGTASLGQGTPNDGVDIDDGATHNQIGGTNTLNTDGTVRTRLGNVISGNGRDGVAIYSASNVVLGNFLGTDITGNVAIPNYGGVGLLTGSESNTIGGTTPGARNIISGNRFGVEFGDDNGAGIAGASNVLEGNYIGTNADASAAIPNTWGVGVYTDQSGNVIGGQADGAGNLISGNTEGGIRIELCPDLVVADNLIGTNAAGTAPLNGPGRRRASWCGAITP